MAQRQQLRRENKTDEREVHVEKDKVPKITSHFESITVENSGNQPVVHHDISRIPEQKHEYEGPSLEEISKYRGAAQQNSMEAIRAAEQQYQHKLKATGGQQNLSGGQNLPSAAQTAAEKAKDYTVQKGQQAKESLSSAAEKAARAKDYTVQKGQQTGQQAKESLSSAAQTATEKAAIAKDYTVQKGQQTGQQAKESISSAAQTAMEKSSQAKDVVAEKASGITSTAVDVSKKGASYVGEKAVAAKDVALESGKASAGYVGKVAGVVKDKAVVAGWSAAEFASEKAASATETTANVVSGVAGFAGNTVVATKDVLSDVVKKTKDTVVATGESAKEFAARKKAEKQRELEAKNAKGEGEWVGEEQEERLEYEGFVEEGDYEHNEGGGYGGGGGVMRVIGETLVEIGQNTKDMLSVGKGGYEGEGTGSKHKFRG